MQLKKTFLFTVIILTILSCKKNDVTKVEQPEKADVYSAGVVDKGFVAEATIWKNGEAVTLPSPTKVHSTISAIAVNGTDVYAVGSYFAGSGPYTYVACYWKNGVFTALSAESNYSEASGIVISGNDIYISGKLNEHAVYWKNGNLTSLPENGFTRSATADLIFNGGNIYVCGTVSTNFTTQACYWKNGTLSVLSTDNSSASDIDFNETVLYIAGSLYLKNDISGASSSRACYWKNGNPVMLPDNNSASSYASGINFLNNDIFVVGNADAYSQQASAAFWKNGTLTRLTDGKEYSGGNEIAFLGNDVYIVGTSKAGYATIWKNSVPTQLSQNGSSVRAIVIVKR